MKTYSERSRSPITDDGHGTHRDKGFSLVEILVSIVLLGVVSTAAMVTLRTSVRASSLDRDHANAHAWLQTASDVLYGSPRMDCGTTTSSQEALVRAYYQSVVRTTENPQDWPATQIEVVGPVLFWDGTSRYQSTCYDDAGINLQLITLQVRAPDGKIVESVQVVKG